MSQLIVNNNMLEYKGTSYNIHQISTMQLAEVKIKNKLSFHFLKYTVPVSIVSIGLSYFLLFRDRLAGISLENCKLYFFAVGVTGGYLLFYSIKKTYFLIKNKFFYLYGLSFKMSNGENPYFVCSSKSLLLKIKNDINKAINNGSNMIDFGNVNIKIEDSSNIQIGNIIER